MGFLTFTLSIVAVFLGIIGGFLLSWIAPEELLPGKKYFVFAERLTLAVILLLFVYFLQLGLFYEMLLLVLILFFVTVANLKSIIFFPFTALILVFLVQYQHIFMLFSVLIFIYGMIISTLFCSGFVRKENFTEKPRKILFRLILKYFSFLVVGIVAYLILSII